MKTKGHPLFIPPTYEEVEKRFEEIGYKGGWKYKGVKKLADLASFHLAGELVENGIIEATSYEREFSSKIPWNKLTGTSPLEKTASLIALIDGLPTQPSIEEVEDRLDLFSKFFNTPLIQSKIKETIVLTPKQLDLLEKVAVISSRGKIKSRKPLDKRIGQQMTSYNQIGNPLSVTDFVLPTFGMKMVTKQLVVSDKERATKQSLLLLVDTSTSMTELKGEKLKWVAAILADRLLAVYENRAELLIIPFDHKSRFDRQVLVKNKEKAMFYLNQLRKGLLPFVIDGGGTRIHTAIRQVEKELKGKWQTVIVNDGQDSISPYFKPKFETHGFILGQDNEDLKTVITNSGGHFERFL